VNPPIAAVLLGAIFVLIPGERRRAPLANFDLLGTVLVTGGMLLLVFALVKAPDQGWGSGRTIGELIGAGVLLAAFVVNEQRSRNPLVPLSIFKVRGLAAADVTQLIGTAGFLSMFFFLTLYMQNVLGFSPLKTGAAYLPLTAGVVVAAGIASQLMSRIGTRPMIVGGAGTVAAGLLLLSRVPADGSYLADLLPGLMIVSFGVGVMFVAVTTAANAGVPADKAGLAAALLNSSQQIGAALGLAVLSAIATARTKHLFAANASPAHALTGGFHRALLIGSVIVLVTAVIALRTSNTRGEVDEPPVEPARDEPALVSR
jgi:predicted MFS family arabinose efflux permease